MCFEWLKMNFCIEQVNSVIWIKDRLQTLLHIGCAHNKCDPHCPNFAFLKSFLN